MLHFFPVPPSKRQAAGPLTENLPNVCLVNELQALTDRSPRSAARISREGSLHKGTLSRLSSYVVCLKAPAIGLARSNERFPATEGSSRLGTRELKGKSC